MSKKTTITGSDGSENSY